MKVMQVVSSYGIGGGEKVVYNIVDGLKNDFTFSFAGPDKKGEFFDVYQNSGLRIFNLGNGKNTFRMSWSLRKLIFVEKPDILHCHGTRAAVWTRIAVLGLKKRPKVLYTLHGFHIIRHSPVVKTILLFAEKFLNNFTDYLITVSDSDTKLVEKHRSIASKKIIEIKNGINIANDIKDTEFTPKNKFTLFSAARLHPPKDFITVLEAMSELKRRGVNIKLQIAGDGPDRPLIEEAIKKLGLIDEVVLLGFMKDVNIFLKNSDVVILSSAWEGLPLIILEAGVFSKPVIASDVDGISEVVKDGETGLLFKFGSHYDLMEKIMILYKNSDFRVKLGNTGNKYVKENYSLEIMLKKYKDLYQNIYENTASK